MAWRPLILFCAVLGCGALFSGCGRLGFEPGQLAHDAAIPADSGDAAADAGADAAADAGADAAADAAADSAAPNCGDGTREGTEECDDGNAFAHDGCDVSCRVELNWRCSGAGPSLCTRNGFVTVPAGSFTMGAPLTEVSRFGDDETQHPVVLTRDILFQATEITQGDFESVTGWNPSIGAACGANCPVENVSFHDVLAYANAVSRSEGLVPCYSMSVIRCGDGLNVGADDQGCMSATRRGIASAAVAVGGSGSVYDCEGYRLPTEAEWEFGARGGDARATYNGELESATLLDCGVANPTLDPIAWFCGNSVSAIHPVAGLRANAWGIFDTAGNVWEWNWDWSVTDIAAPATDPEGPATGTARAVRGGCYDNTAGHLRAANRWAQVPSFRNGLIGGRLSRTLP